METANEKGILGSTMTGEALLENEQRAEQQAAAYIPQYREQAYGQFTDRLRNAADLLSTARNLGNDEFDRSYKEATMTGSYLPPDAENKINRIIQLGEAWKTGTPEQRAQYHQEADALRGELKTMGIDPSLFGSNVSTADRNANLGKSGIRTLAGQAQDMNNTQTMAALTGYLPNGQKTSAQQQVELGNLWEEANQTGTIPDKLADLYGIPRGTQTQRAKEFALSNALQQDSNDLQWSKLDADLNHPQGSNNGGLTTNQVLENIKSLYTEPVYQGTTRVGSKITTDPMKREQMFLDVVDMHLPSANETMQVLRALGMTRDEIDQYKKKYAGN